jgi:kumamolisin
MSTASSERAELPNSVHHLPTGSIARRRTNQSQWLELTLGVRRLNDLPDLSALDTVLPSKRRYMTHDELETTYGSNPAAVARIEAFAEAHHLVVLRSAPASAKLTLGGTVADVSAAFGVTLFNYSHPTLGDFHARTGPVSVPSELAGDITAVFGFNNHRILRRKHQLRNAETANPTNESHPWFVPTELAQVYNFPDADANNQCIGLLEFGGGVEDSDLTAYFAKIGQPKPNVQVIALNDVSTEPSADPDSTGEVMLDIEVVGALAGGAKVAVYFSTFDEKGLIDALSAVINDTTNKPGVVSVSWGWDENQPLQNGILWSPAAMDHVNHSMLAAAHLGITVCVSTGDDGAEAQIKDGRAHVNFPATSPYDLAVGGTTLHVKSTSNGQAHVAEVVWNDGPGDGTGGGISDITPVPDWQKALFRRQSIPATSPDAAFRMSPRMPIPRPVIWSCPEASSALLAAPAPPHLFGGA